MIIIASAIACYNLHAHRQQPMVKVKIKNKSDFMLTIPTHQGTIALRPQETKSFDVQRGESYDLKASANTKNGVPLGITTAKFTPGYYEITAESDTASSDTNAVLLKVTKPNLEPKTQPSYYFPRRYYSQDYDY